MRRPRILSNNTRIAFVKAGLWGFLVLATGCTGIPDGVTPVDGFDVNRYVGTWYEIARLDHSFERGLNNVTATYSLREDGGIKVVNKGFDNKSQEWKIAEGKAYFVDEPTIGRLKVSFFGPFYGGYNVVALDKQNYLYSLVCGPNKSYLWILAREKQLDDTVLTDLIARAKELGFTTDSLIMVKHDKE